MMAASANGGRGSANLSGANPFSSVNRASNQPSRSSDTPQQQQQSVSNPQARNHPLFGVLDFIAQKTQSHSSQLQAVDSRFERLEDSIKAIADLQSELKQLIEQQQESTFSIEKSKYKGPLRTGTANLFCNDLFRHPPEEKIIRMVKSVIKGNEKFVIDAAMKYASSLMVTFRCEERRKVISPVGKYANKDTKTLSSLLLVYMKGSLAHCQNYTRHLAILRKYVRDTPDIADKKNFYQCFKTWIEENYGELSEENWRAVTHEDNLINYTKNSDSLSSATSGTSSHCSDQDSDDHALGSPYSYL